MILIGFLLSITDALCVHSAIWGSSFGPCDSSIRPGGPIWDLLPSSFASSWMKQGSAASVRSSRGLRPWSGGWSLSKRRCRTRSARLGMKAEGSVLLCRTNHESEPRPLPGTQMANHICSVRKKRLTGWKQGHTPEMRFGTPAFGGGFFYASSAGLGGCSRHLSGAPKEEGRPSRWKDGLARSFVHCNRPVQ